MPRRKTYQSWLVNTRKFVPVLHSLKELVAAASPTEYAVRSFEASVTAGLNVLVSGAIRPRPRCPTPYVRPLRHGKCRNRGGSPPTAGSPVISGRDADRTAQSRRSGEVPRRRLNQRRAANAAEPADGLSDRAVQNVRMVESAIIWMAWRRRLHVVPACDNGACARPRPASGCWWSGRVSDCGPTHSSTGCRGWRRAGRGTLQTEA